MNAKNASKRKIIFISRLWHEIKIPFQTTYQQVITIYKLIFLFAAICVHLRLLAFSFIPLFFSFSHNIKKGLQTHG